MRTEKRESAETRTSVLVAQSFSLALCAMRLALGPHLWAISSFLALDSRLSALSSLCFALDGQWSVVQ